MKVLEQLKVVDDEQFAKLYTDLSQQGFGPLDAEVAKHLKFRPQAIRKLPIAQRARQARLLLLRSANAELCYEVFGTWLIKEHKALVTGFLDGTGVTHEEGMIEDLEHNRPDPKKVVSTVAKLDAEQDADALSIYLSLCVEQWPDIAELETIWRERLAVKAGS